MSRDCEDCGKKMVNLHHWFCPNCHEEVFIEEQYHDLGEVSPDKIFKKASKFRRQQALKDHDER